GAFQVRLVVQDSDGQTAVATRQLIVSATYTAEQGGAYAGDRPIADAGPDRDVEPGSRVELDASGSSRALSYAWQQLQGPPVALTAGASVRPSFTAPAVEEPVTLVFQLEVFDGHYLSAPDTVAIRVVRAPKAGELPAVDAGADVTVTSGEIVRLSAAARNFPEGADLQWTWTQAGGPDAAITGSTATIAFHAPAVSRTTDFLLQVRASLGSTTATDSVKVTVNPRVEADGFRFERGTGIQAGLVAFAPLVQGLAYQWEFGDGGTSSEMNPVHTYRASGTYEVRLTVTDAAGKPTTYAQEIRVHAGAARADVRESPAPALLLLPLLAAAAVALRRREGFA
ncbi:MAG TPA: PKD domain-containing protein, partial [Candidatus Thermoplasmatota archaeon]|nr:PKD domain-containing protein [Candidatus Thermoplasmatota archaeon]